MLSNFSGNEATTEYLIKQGLNVSIVDDNGNTALHYAAESGKNE